MKLIKNILSFKYINGTKGAIALFMAVIMTPFLSCAMLLVETGRYNSAVSALDEALGVSSVSLLANYDEYMLDRWGLLAIDQSIDIEKEFSDYAAVNGSVMGSSLQINSIKVSGIYSLADNNIFYNQIMEFSKLNSPTKLATNFSNIADLVSQLEKMANVGKYFDIIGSSAGAFDSSITLAESADELKKVSNTLDSLKTKYANNYQAFENAVKALTDGLKETRPTTEEEAKKYDENIQSLRSDVTSAASNYSSVLNEIADNLQSFKDKMKSCNDSIEKIKTEVATITTNAIQLANQRDAKNQELKALNKKISEMESNGENVSTPALYTQALEQRAELENKIAEITLEEGVASASQSGLTKASDGWKQAFNAYSDSTIGELIQSFKDLKSKVDSFNSATISKDYVLNASEYYYLTIAGYVSAADIDAYLAQQASESNSATLSALIEGITTFFNSLCKLQLFYDPALSSYIDIEYYNNNLGGLPGADSADGGPLAIITDIGNIIGAATKFKQDLLTLKWLSALKEAKKFVTSIIDLGQHIFEFVKGILVNIASLFISYDRLYYSTYTAFNLPCRTDFTSGVPSFIGMTNYKLNASSLNVKGVSSNLTVVDDIVVLIQQIKSAASGTGSDLTFSGAELEYVLFGSNSEVANQMYTFVCIYLLRLLLNMPLVFSNPEVQSIATASTLGYPVIMILVTFVEPLIDTVMLVNGLKIPFIKTSVYMTPSGIVKLIPDLLPLCKMMTQSEKDAMESNLSETFGIAKDDYNYQKTLQKYDGSATSTKTPSKFFEFTYREYCFFLLLLTVTDKQQVGRLQNLIQMETLYYYQNKGVNYTFDLRKSYTYIEVDANVTVKQLMPSLIDSSLFTIDRKMYRGY